MSNLGLIAGGGPFPLLVAKEAGAGGRRDIFCAALTGEASLEIEKHVKKVHWIKLGELKKLTAFFNGEHVQEAIMAGHVRKPKLLNGSIRPDLDMVKLLAKLGNWKDETLLGGLADYLEEHGIRLIDSTTHMRDALAREGVLTKRKPSKKELEDIRFGVEMASQLAALDIGQTVVVKDRCVVAAESAEGTNETIRRGGKLAARGATVVKMARPKQDMRFDVPTVGIETVSEAVSSGIAVLALEAGRTFFFQREEALRLANEHKLAIVGVPKQSVRTVAQQKQNPR